MSLYTISYLDVVPVCADKWQHAITIPSNYWFAVIKHLLPVN